MFGSVTTLVTLTRDPPSWVTRLPQKFSAATTRIDEDEPPPVVAVSHDEVAAMTPPVTPIATAMTAARGRTSRIETLQRSATRLRMTIAQVICAIQVRELYSGRASPQSRNRCGAPPLRDPGPARMVDRRSPYRGAPLARLRRLLLRVPRRHAAGARRGRGSNRPR